MGMRRLVLCGVTALLAACGGGAAEPAPAGEPYLVDASYRRAELVASLVNPQDGYAQQRLEHYATGDANDWDRLPEWNPPVEPVQPSELDAPGGASATSPGAGAAPLGLPDDVASEDDPRLVALGEAAFHRYPVQLAPYLRVALASRDAAARYGLWVDDRAGVGGLVREQLADGSGAVALTCASCHEARVSGALVPGRPNDHFEIGAAMLDGANPPIPAGTAAAIGAWGPGRLDVTTSTGLEPVRIADLRPVKWLTHLQADATVHQIDRTALAIRIETLIVTSAGETVRPPRVVALALAAYVASLAQALPDEAAAAASSPRGAQVFEQACTACHQGTALTGPPVPLAVVGTDPTLGQSAVRGTGTYRVPSMHGVGTRGALLHDGTVPSLAAMFDPARTSPGYPLRLHGPGAIPGHPFGMSLDADDRAALVAFLSAL